MILMRILPTAPRARPGFTLIETIVTVGLLAVLAAFVVPSVIRKADAADPVKVANDLNAISTALQTFTADMKGLMPGDIQDLTQPVLVNAMARPLPSCTLTPCPPSTIEPMRVTGVPAAAAAASNFSASCGAIAVSTS